MPAPPAREHSVETIRRNSEVMGNLRKLMVANRGVSFAYQLFLFYVFFFANNASHSCRKSHFVYSVQLMNFP